MERIEEPYAPASGLLDLSLEGALSPADMSVGATRLFFGCWGSSLLFSSFSDSLAGLPSRLPRTLLFTEFGPFCDTADIGV